MGKCSFKPNHGLVVLEVPADAYPDKNVIPTKQQWLTTIKEKANEFVNGELVVATVGEDVDFVKEGDKVNLASRALVQLVETESDVEERFMDIWFVVRQSEILVKF